MAQTEFRPGLIPLVELYSNEFTEWLRMFMSTGPLPLVQSDCVARPNDWVLAPLTNGAHVVMRSVEGKVNTYFNVCPHRRKTLIEIPTSDSWDIDRFTGSRRLIVCSGHSWSFTTTGARAPKSPGCEGLTLAGETRDIGGLMWVGSREELDRVASIFTLPLMLKYGITSFVPKGYMLHAVKVDRAKFRPVTGLKVYGDVDHVDDKYHTATLKRVTDISRLEIDVSATCGSVSLQVVPWTQRCNYKGATKAWARWHEEVRNLQAQFPDDESLRRIAWMQESRSGWTGEQFPGMYVDSIFMPDPDGPGTINIVAFYFPEEILNTRDPETADTDCLGDLVHWATKAYWEELAKEDAVLCEEEDRGCLTLIRYGKGDLTDGTYGIPEEGVSYQYEQWLARHWNAYKSR